MQTRDQGVSTDQSHGEPTTIPVLPGAFFLAQIPGWVGRGVSAAQAFTRGGSLWTHCGIYVGSGEIVQAEPGGARLCRFDDCYRGQDVLWSDAPVQRHVSSDGFHWSWPEEAKVRDRVVDAARSLVDTPYGWLDYLVIAAAEWRWPRWERLVELTEQRGHLICSALVDRTYALAGIHLFTDNRPPGLVTPADLARLDEAWVRNRLTDLEVRVAQIEERLG